MSREILHELVDRIPESEIMSVQHYLEFVASTTQSSQSSFFEDRSISDLAAEQGVASQDARSLQGGIADEVNLEDFVAVIYRARQRELES